MAAWLEITEDAANANNCTAAVFFIRNEDTAMNIAPLPEQPPAPSKMSAAKNMVSTAITSVSSWVKMKARSSQTQEPQDLASQENERPRRNDSKRVPRSQRLADATAAQGGAGACTESSWHFSQFSYFFDFDNNVFLSWKRRGFFRWLSGPGSTAPRSPKEIKSSSKGSFSFRFRHSSAHFVMTNNFSLYFLLSEPRDTEALDPLGIAAESTLATSQLPPLHIASFSRDLGAQQSFKHELDDEPAGGAATVNLASRRKGGLKDLKIAQSQDVTGAATEGRRRFGS
jgi:hypothetical protein